MSLKTRILKDALRNVLVLVPLVLFCSMAWAQQPTNPPKTNGETKEEPKKFRWTLEAGGQVRDVNGDRPSKFEEYKAVRKGFLFRRGGASYNPENSPTFFNLAVRNLSERDQQYYFEGGRYGRFRTIVSFDQQPHLYSRGDVTLLRRSAPGVYTVPDGIQSALQALDPPFTNGNTTPNPALLAAVRSYLATSANTIDVRSGRRTIGVEQRLNLTPNWSFRVRFLDTRRDGARPLGTGSYERTPTAAGIGDTFRAHELELPAEIDYRTDNFTFGTSYVTAKWGVNFDYSYSTFHNGIDAYTYDNPFRLVDQQANGNGGVWNRMAFAMGQEAAYPDNQAHSFTISAFADLPFYSRWAGAVGWSRWTQNEPFLPYTLNTAIVAGNLGGHSPTELSTLPQPSLEGEIDNLTVDQLFTTRFIKHVTLNFHYRAYDYKNKTDQILFPGYAAFLESWWRTSIVGSYGTRDIENEPVSYLRQRATGEVIWDINKKLRWRGEYEWEGWTRENRNVRKSNEHKLGTFVTYKPTNQWKFDIDYRYQDRTPESYDPGLLENQLLRTFDQAKRLRNDVYFKWQWAASPKLGLSGDFAYLSDVYDRNFYGTSQLIERRASVEALFNPRENMTIYANYSREHYNTLLQSIAKTGTPFDVRNRWNREDRNINDNFGIGVSTYLADSKWFVDVNYALNYGRDLITTANITAPASNAITNATAYPFPEATLRYNEFSFDTNYQIQPKAALGFRYYYEPFRLDDWQWNDLSPYPVDTLAPETDGRRFLLLDSRYSSHNAHIFSIYIRFGN